MDIEVYYKLLEKSRKVNWQNTSRKEYFVLFSFHGYTDKLRELAEEQKNLLLYRK